MGEVKGLCQPGRQGNSELAEGGEAVHGTMFFHDELDRLEQ